MMQIYLYTEAKSAQICDCKASVASALFVLASLLLVLYKLVINNLPNTFFKRFPVICR